MRILLTVCLCLQLAALSFGRQPARPTAGPADWLRVRSDNGDFSVEIPTSYTYYFNSEGPLTAQMGTSTTYRLPDMRVVNSVVNETLISLESFRAGKGALGALYEADIRNRDGVEKSDLKIDDVKVRQLVFRDDKSYMVRRYLNLGSGIYILTAASRSGETAEIKRFLDSLSVRGKGGQPADDGAIPIASLKMTEVTVEMDLIDDSKPGPRIPPPPKQPPDPTVESLVVLIKPRAIYTDAARTSGVQGTIRVKVTFSEKGFISQIVVRKALSEGLLRQALLSAVRIKFLPAKKNDTPISVSRIMEYSFAIY